MNFQLNSTAFLILPLIIFVVAFLFSLLNSSKNVPSKDSNVVQKKTRLSRIPLAAAYQPVSVILIVSYVKFLYFSLGIIHYENSILKFVFEDLYFVTVLLLITWGVTLTLSEFKKKMITKMALEERARSGLDNNPKRTKVNASTKVISGVWLVVVSFLIMDHFGVPVSSILALGGMGSIVIGFAAKDVMGDLISGFLIYLDGQFDIGEWIKLEDPKIEGTVEHIGWRVSRIRTFDDRPLYVPNGLLSKAIIQNVSRRESMRIKEYITISIESAQLMSTICKEIRKNVLQAHDGIDQDRSIVVNLASYQAGVCWIYVSAFTRSGDMEGFYGIKQDVLIKIHSVLLDHDVNIDSPKVPVNQVANMA